MCQGRPFRAAARIGERPVIHLKSMGVSESALPSDLAAADSATLVRALSERHPRAARAVFYRFAPLVRRIVRRSLSFDGDVDDAVQLLLVSAIRLTELCLPHLERSGRGRVINIESSTVREPTDELALSNVVRPGVVGWAKSLAREVGHAGITINTVCPGRIETERLRESYPSQEQIDRILPQATASFLAIKSGKASMMALEVDAF